VVVFVTVNNGKASKVKFLDTEAFKWSLLFNYVLDTFDIRMSSKLSTTIYYLIGNTCC
jgi:hypothetical protein